MAEKHYIKPQRERILSFNKVDMLRAPDGYAVVNAQAKQLGIGKNLQSSSKHSKPLTAIGEASVGVL